MTVRPGSQLASRKQEGTKWEEPFWFINPSSYTVKDSSLQTETGFKPFMSRTKMHEVLLFVYFHLLHWMDAMDWFNQFQQLAEYEGAESSLNSFSLHFSKAFYVWKTENHTIRSSLRLFCLKDRTRGFLVLTTVWVAWQPWHMFVEYLICFETFILENRVFLKIQHFPS